MSKLPAQEWLGYDPEKGDIHGYTFEQMREFRDSIVKECFTLFIDQRYMVLNPYEPFAEERVRALKEHDKYSVRKIKQHFGVV